MSGEGQARCTARQRRQTGAAVHAGDGGTIRDTEYKHDERMVAVMRFLARIVDCWAVRPGCRPLPPFRRHDTTTTYVSGTTARATKFAPGGRPRPALHHCTGRRTMLRVLNCLSRPGRGKAPQPAGAPAQKNAQDAKRTRNYAVKLRRGEPGRQDGRSRYGARGKSANERYFGESGYDRFLVTSEPTDRQGRCA